MFFVLQALSYRGWYAGANLGLADRTFDPKIDKAKFVESKLNKKLKLDPSSRTDALVEAFNKEMVFGLKEHIYGEVDLGYFWRMNHWFISLSGMAYWEPRASAFKVSYDGEFNPGKELYNVNVNNLYGGGLILKAGYYITPSTAILGVFGLEAGKSMHFMVKHPTNPNVFLLDFTIPDAGIRLGVEAKIDVKNNCSFTLGFHHTVLPVHWQFKTKLEKDYGIKAFYFTKTRVLIGCQYQFYKIDSL